MLWLNSVLKALASIIISEDLANQTEDNITFKYITSTVSYSFDFFSNISKAKAGTEV